MTAKKFSSALGNIGENYIEEAITYNKSKKNIWGKWGSIAACLCLCAVLSIAGLKTLLVGRISSGLDIDTENNSSGPDIETEDDKKTADTTETVETKNPNEGVGGPSDVALDGYHHEMYYAIDFSFAYNFVSEEEFAHFGQMFENTKDFTYRGMCEYFGISKDEYVAFWEKMRTEYEASYLAEKWPFDYMYIMESHYDEWFADDYEINRVFMADESSWSEAPGKSYISAERSDDYILRYYTIDYKLIDYVGKDDFDKYLSEAEHVNIKTFIEYFNIALEDYLQLYELPEPNPYNHKLYPYNPDYLFSGESFDEYFKVHPENKK